jgi:TetR/AcrR family transcriptional regulator
MEVIENTEERILVAARKVFMQKGLAGSRMQDIADEAGINKALLHYYYRTKEKLFEIIFLEHKQKMFGNLVKILDSDKSVLEKIELIIEHEQDSLQALPQLPLFIMNEVNCNPERVMEMHDKMMKDVQLKFFAQVEKEIAEGKIRPIKPLDLMLNLVGLNVFPYLSMPMFGHIMEMSEAEIQTFMKNRRHTIKEFIFNALKPN